MTQLGTISIQQLATMQTGWKQLGNKWYYLRSLGAMATGWYQEGSTWYYLDPVKWRYENRLAIPR